MGKKVSELIEIDSMRELGDLPVFLGGPVNPDQLTFASLKWEAQEEQLGFDTHLSSDEALHRLREGFMCVHLLVIQGGLKGSWSLSFSSVHGLHGNQFPGLQVLMLTSVFGWNYCPLWDPITGY